MAVVVGTAEAGWWADRRPESAAAIAAPGLAAGALVMVAIGLAIAVRWSVDVAPHAVLIASLYPTIGSLIVWRHPRNAVGWILVANGVINAMVVLSNAWAPVALDLAPGSLPFGVAAGQVMAWLADGIWLLSHGMLVALVPLLVPDGKLPSRRWLPVLAFNVSAIAVSFGAPLSVLSQLRLRRSFDEFYPDERLAASLGELGTRLVLAGGVAAVVSLIWRMARLPRDERGPYVWFAAGAAAAVVLLVPFNLIPWSPVHEVVRVTSVLVVPIGAAVAILHRRAYGIDVVVNRTLVYGSLTVALAAVYLLAVAAVEVLVSVSSTFSTVVAAGAVAIVLSPLRDRLQRGANQLLYGRRDEPHVVAAAVTKRLEAVAGGADTLHDVVEEIGGSLRFGYVGLEVDTIHGVRTVASWGDQSEAVERFPLVTRGRAVGTLLVGGRRGQAQLAVRDRAALREVAPIAAAAVRQVQLTDDLRLARGRLATALEEERRRIRRDLHDGLGPALATVVMGLEEARAVHRTDHDRTERLLTDLKSQTRAAIEDIRALVYGLRPPALDELGVAAAVRQLVDNTLGRTSIDAHLVLPDELPELPAAIEVAAYRIVQEALTNVVRHAGAAQVTVSITMAGPALVVEVRDDGCGVHEDARAGVGMTSMRERVEDIGGSVAWTNGLGTTVRARLPLPR